MYCPNCGKLLENDARFCDACGTAIETENAASEESVVNETIVEAPVYTAPVEEVPEKKQAKCWSVFAKVSKILGIVSMAICWIPFAALCTTGPYGIVFGCLGNVAKDEESKANKKTGITLSIIGSVISLFVYIIMIVVIAALASGASEPF